MVMSFFLYMKNEKEIFYHIYNKEEYKNGGMTMDKSYKNLFQNLYGSEPENPTNGSEKEKVCGIICLIRSFLTLKIQTCIICKCRTNFRKCEI